MSEKNKLTKLTTYQTELDKKPDIEPPFDTIARHSPIINLEKTACDKAKSVRNGVCSTTTPMAMYPESGRAGKLISPAD